MEEFYITLILIVLFYFLLREVNCWYWKINERLKIEKKILKELRMLNQTKSGNSEILTKEDVTDFKDRKYRKINENIEEKAMCFYCREISKKANLLYDRETDTYIHEKCARIKYHRE
ncbi:MAG: hypothetical protein PF689_10645 [Deltaproteobacteria bacterium]|jgi:hypothetical protein|nr:hypothetical protein [Deltaproteobacteria bacterium]